MFRRQWRRLFLHPELFICGTFGQFLHIVEHSFLNSAFLYLSVAEFRALQELTQETPPRPVPFHLLPPTNINSYCTPNPNPNPNPQVSEDPLSNTVDYVYPQVTAPTYQEYSS